MSDQGSEAHDNNQVENIHVENESQPNNQNTPKTHESQATTPNNHNPNPLGLDPNVMGQLLIELLKKTSQQDDSVEEIGSRLIERVAKQNPKTYTGKVDPVKLEDWIRSMEKIFEVVQVPENRKVSVGTYYLEGQADIWWNTIKEKQNEPGFNWGKFLDVLRQKFYPRAIQRQKENEFLRLKQGDMSVMEYTEKFMELSRFAPDYVASEKLRKTRFEEGLADYIRGKISGHFVSTFQDLYEMAADIERVRNEIRDNNSGGSKRKWDNKGNQSNVNNSSKRPIPNFNRSQIPTLQPCKKCGRTNHTTSNCREGKNVCQWCASPQHDIFTCPQRAVAVTQGRVKPFRVDRPINPQNTTNNIGKAFVMNRKEASRSGTEGKGTNQLTRVTTNKSLL